QKRICWLGIVSATDASLPWVERAAFVARAAATSLRRIWSSMTLRAHQRPCKPAARGSTCSGFIACGGFSHGDTLGAGEGWARSILFNPAVTEQFAIFFQRKDTFALGV